MKNLIIFVLVVALALLLTARLKPEWVPFLVGTPLNPGQQEQVDLPLPPASTRTAPGAAAAGPPMYRWTDAAGKVHLSDRPPASGAYETLRFDPNTNVIPAQPGASAGARDEG